MKAKTFDLALAPTAPCNSSCDTSIAAEIVVEGRAAIAVMPTGECRRELRARLNGLEGEVEAWDETPPSEDERRRVTAEALNLFCDIGEQK